MKPGKHQRRIKYAKICVGKSTTLQKLFLLCSYESRSSFVSSFRSSFTMHELRNQHVSISWFLSTEYWNNYCVLCRVKALKENKNIPQRTLTSFTAIPLAINTSALWIVLFGCAFDGGSPDTTDPYTVAFLDLTLLLGSSFVCSIDQRDLWRYYLLSHLQLDSSPSGF